jgi:hypothetical protein
VRDRSAEYKAAGARVIGISPDEVDAVGKFAGKFDLDSAACARNRGFGSRRSPPRGGGSPSAIASPFRVGHR